jgi:prevent-host-death family protein
MKRMQYAEDIVPLGEFKTHASRVLRQLASSGRPVVITQNGRPAAVLSTPKDFDRLRRQERFVRAVQDGLADARAGRLISDAQATKELDEEFGPLDTE